MNIVPIFPIFIPLLFWTTVTGQNGHQNHNSDPSRSVLFGPDGKFTRCCPEDALKRLHSLKTIYRSIFFTPEDTDCSRCRLYDAILKHIGGAVSEDVREASKMIVDEEFGKYFSEKLHEKRERFYRGVEKLQSILEMEEILQGIQDNLGVSQDTWRMRKLQKSSALPLSEDELKYSNGVSCEKPGEIPMLRIQDHSWELVYPSGRRVNVASPEALNSLVQFYAKNHKCLEEKELEEFHEKLLNWISFRVLPILEHSQRVLPAFGAIHRINATIQEENNRSSLSKIYSRFSEVSENSGNTFKIMGVIAVVTSAVTVLLLAFYYCVWRARKSTPFKGKYKKLRNPRNSEQKKKSSKNTSENSRSSGEEIELFSRSGNIESDSEESITLENATIIHTSPRRKIFREFSTPAFKLLGKKSQEKPNQPKEAHQTPIKEEQETEIPEENKFP